MEKTNIIKLTDCFADINKQMERTVTLFSDVTNNQNEINHMSEDIMHVFYYEFDKISDALLNIGNMLIIHDQLS